MMIWEMPMILTDFIVLLIVQEMCCNYKSIILGYRIKDSETRAHVVISR